MKKKITVFESNQSFAKFNIFYGKKRFKNNSYIDLQEKYYFTLREKKFFSNKVIFVLCWLIIAIFWIISNYCGDPKCPKPIKEIRINYGKIFSSEIKITIDNDAVNVEGLEINSIICDGIEQVKKGTDITNGDGVVC